MALRLWLAAALHVSAATPSSSPPALGLQHDLFTPGALVLDPTSSYRRPVACYRLPALLLLPNNTLLAFASARNWTGDGCHPLHPVANAADDSFRPHRTGQRRGLQPHNHTPPINTDTMTHLALRVSTDGGGTWGPIKKACEGQFIDYQALCASSSLLPLHLPHATLTLSCQHAAERRRLGDRHGGCAKLLQPGTAYRSLVLGEWQDRTTVDPDSVDGPRPNLLQAGTDQARRARRTGPSEGAGDDDGSGARTAASLERAEQNRTINVLCACARRYAWHCLTGLAQR